VDTNKERLPVSIEININFESPWIGVLSEERPEHMEIAITVTVSSLESGVW
jgi:hypothetical protein